MAVPIMSLYRLSLVLEKDFGSAGTFPTSVQVALWHSHSRRRLRNRNHASLSEGIPRSIPLRPASSGGDYTCRKVGCRSVACIATALNVSHQVNISRYANDFQNCEMCMFKHIVGISVHYAVTAAGFQSYDMVTRLSPSKIDGFSELPNFADVCRRLPTIAEFFSDSPDKDMTCTSRFPNFQTLCSAYAVYVCLCLSRRIEINVGTKRMP
ncbi:hypothetical protein M092_2366 [Parabacteroides distasonis str. 3776 D15 iv]|uniref:Uncharacterized protein n=2 Tax=Parabacteroides distasonis TaxID=823 RepID=A0AB34L4F5_PARDI|nr:hypothetical protein M091_2068 [Parabacteroides distasonis str. 3776 D15 i]KDS42436.1 hypothetical protein M090_0584 [Parabacteroides distasonis str. 3776 Po2 i]KDS70691.1 hypothetical protein M092_2366 [Parabacteroides distasonis str. 3776 D15 iv]